MAERLLHIGVDARELLGQPTGVGRYLGQVLLEWRRDPRLPHRVTLFVPAEPSTALRSSYRGFEWAVEAGSASGTMWEQTTLPRALDRASIDVFFAAGYTAPITTPCPFVVAIYDVSFFAHPEWFGWREGLRRRFLTRRAAHRASAVVTISEFSIAEIVRFLGISRNRIVLAPPGAPPVVPRRPEPHSHGPTVLFVGSIFTRRHIPDLLRAFGGVARRVPDARLVIVGDNRTNPRIDPLAVAGDLGIRDRVEWREYAGDDELAHLYSTATAFAFLSDYEGFAMTPMEALARGTPVVLLDTPVAREVYGDGATFVPLSPPVITEALSSLLTDGATRADLVARGQRRLAAFSWNRTAALVRQALEKAAE